MDKNDVIISISADSRGVEAGVRDTRLSLAKLDAHVKQTSRGMERMGDGGDKAAQKVARDTKSMERSLQGLLAKLEGGSRESRKYWETMAEFKGVDKNALSPLLSQLDQYQKKQKVATGAASEFAMSLAGVQKALVSAGAAAAAMKFIGVADSVTTLGNQLRLAAGSIEAATSAYHALFDIAQRSRVGFVELGETYASIARAAEPLGVSQERLLKVTESIGNAMTISGGSAQGLQAALVQLGQGLSSGVLRGEELNSVMEQAPRLAKALADGLGVTTGQLRAMGQEGEITAEKVINALESQSSVLKGEVAGATLTVGQSFTQLGNSATYAVGELDKAVGVSTAVAGAVSSVASAVDGLGRVVGNNEATIKAVLAFGGVVVGAKAAAVAVGGVATAMAAARVATVGFTAALAANPIGAALLTITALGAATYSAAGAMGEVESGARGTGQAVNAAAKELKALEAASIAVGHELTKAEERLAALELRGAKGSANLMLREAHADAQRLVDKLREAKRERDELLRLSAGFVNGLRDSEAGNSRGSRSNYYKELFDSQQFLAQRNDGITKQFAADLEGLARAYANGALSASEYAKAVTEANKKRYESTEAGRAEAKALKEAEKGAKSGANAYQSLAKSVAEKIAAQRQELIYGTRLTDIDKLRIRVEQEMTGARKAGLLAQLQIAKANERELEARAAFIAMAEAEKKARQDVADAAEKAAGEFADSNKALREEIELIGLSEEAQHAINQARLQAQITVKEQHLAELQRANDVHDFMSREQIALEEQIRLLKERLGLMDDKRVRDANAKAQDRLEKEWDRTAQTIGDTLADYIMGGGKDAATYLKRLFSTLVLQPVVQTVVGGIMGTGTAAASGAGAGMMDRLANSGGGLTNWSLWGEKASGFAYDASLKSLEYGMTDTAKSFVSLGNSIQKVDGFLKEIPGMKGGLGSAFGYGQAIYSLTQGNYGSAIGTAIGTYILPGIGTMIGSTLGGLVDGMFGSNPHDHRGGVYSNATGNRNEVLKGLGLTSGPERSDFTSRGNQAVSTALGTTIDQLLGAYDTLAERATGAARDLSVYAGFATNPKDKDQNAYGYLRIFDAATQELLYKATHRNSSDKLGSDPAQAFNAFTGEIAGVLVQQLKAADLPGWMRGIFDGMGETVTLESFSAAMQQIQAIDYQIDMLGKTMTMFAGISDSMKTSLLGAAGSIENLTGIASGYYGSSLFTEGERMLSARKQQMDALASMGLYIDPAEGEKAKELFRKTVEEAMATGQGELAVSLMAMSASFAQVADYAANLFDDVAASAAQARAQAITGAWGNLGTASGWAAQYLGDSRGLQAQLGVVQASYKGATTVQGREAALEQIIALEQSLWQVEERNRQAAAQAAQQQAEALQSQLASVNSLIAAAQNLGKYAEGLFTGADSGLGDQERLDILAAQYSTQLSLAKAGDTDAMSSLQGTTSAYLQLAQQLSGSQSEYSVLSGRIAAELAATAAISGASAKTQADTLQAQIDAALAQAQYASQQFEVSAATKELIAKQLADSAKQFDSEMKLLQDQLQSGLDANLLLAEMPAELTGVLNDTLVPVIGRISDAAMSAASMSAASAEAARQAAAAASAAASSAAAAAIANARKGIDGSHAGGLSYVPFDGYTAELHKGERVLTAAENRMFSMPAIQVQSQNSSKELEKKVERLEAQMARMADATERLLDITDRVTADGNANATEIMNVRELAKAIAEEMA